MRVLAAGDSVDVALVGRDQECNILVVFVFKDDRRDSGGFGVKGNGADLA